MRFSMKATWNEKPRMACWAPTLSWYERRLSSGRLYWRNGGAVAQVRYAGQADVDRLDVAVEGVAPVVADAQGLVHRFDGGVRPAAADCRHRKVDAELGVRAETAAQADGDAVRLAVDEEDG